MKINLENKVIYNRLTNTSSDLSIEQLVERNQKHQAIVERLRQFDGNKKKETHLLKSLKKRNMLLIKSKSKSKSP